MASWSEAGRRLAEEVRRFTVLEGLSVACDICRFLFPAVYAVSGPGLWHSPEAAGLGGAVVYCSGTSGSSQMCLSMHACHITVHLLA